MHWSKLYAKKYLVHPTAGRTQRIQKILKQTPADFYWVDKLQLMFTLPVNDKHKEKQVDSEPLVEYDKQMLRRQEIQGTPFHYW